eukprot:gene3368-5269_t
MALSLASSNRGFADTRALQDDLLQRCYASGEEKEVAATTRTLQTLSAYVRVTVQRQLDDARSAQTELMKHGQMLTADEADTPAAYTMYPQILTSIWDSRDISILFHVTMPHKSDYGMLLLENSLAAEHNEEHRRHPNSSLYISSVAISNVVRNDTKAPTLLGTLNAAGGGFHDAPCDLAQSLVAWSGGISGPCGVNLSTSQIGLLQDSYPIPADTVRWSKVYTFSAMTGVVIVGSFRSHVEEGPRSSEKLGLAGAGFDLKTLRRFLATVAAEKSREFDIRLFIVQGGSGHDQAGWLLGVSHGDMSREVLTVDPVFPRMIRAKTPVHCTNATDPTIRTASSYLYDLAGVNADDEDAVYKGTTDVFSHFSLQVQGLPVILNGSRHYLLADDLSDEFGLNWWIVSVVEEESVVGDTRARKVEAQSEVDRSNKEVTEQIEDDRLLLLGIVALASFAILGVSGFGVALVSKSLEVLTNDIKLLADFKMDTVALHSASWIRELKDIQQSFLIMHRAMKEYKKFMPQAVTDFEAQ